MSPPLAAAFRGLALLLALSPVASTAQAIGPDLRVFVNPTPGVIDVDGAGQVIAGSRGTAVLEEMARGAGLRFDIQAASVPRALIELESRASNCVSGLIKTKEREARFLWVGPLTRTQLSIFARSDFVGPVSRLEDLRGASVMALRGSVPAQLLADAGIKVVHVAHLETGLRMLSAGRMDLLASSDSAIETGGLPALSKGLKPVVSLGSAEYFLACNAGTSTAVMQRLKNSVEGMRVRGVLRPYGVF